MNRFLLSKKIVHYAFIVVTVLVIITGFGITEYRTVEPLTSGLLTKALSFSLHIALEIPFIVLLVLHIYLTIIHPRISRR